jgi:hypothetical protein
MSLLENSEQVYCVVRSRPIQIGATERQTCVISNRQGDHSLSVKRVTESLFRPMWGLTNRYEKDSFQTKLLKGELCQG